MYLKKGDQSHKDDVQSHLANINSGGITGPSISTTAIRVVCFVSGHCEAFVLAVGSGGVTVAFVTDRIPPGWTNDQEVG